MLALAPRTSEVFDAWARVLDPREIVEPTMMCGVCTMASRLGCGVDMNPECFGPE
ncbi:MAG: hypothetical protein WCK28_05050 [Burkholderiales bacterium]